MANYRICPQCAGQIAPDKKMALSICPCGWYDGKSQKTTTRKLSKQAAFTLIGAMALVALLFGHIATWGVYSTSIPVLRLRQVTGLLTPEGYNHLAKACLSVGKFECAENAYEQMARKSQKPEGLLKLARLESRLGKIPASFNAYQRYIKLGGKDGRALLAYGRLLEFHHQDSLAMRIYNQSYKQAKLSGDFGLGAQATSGAVNILVRKGKFKDAYVQLQNFRGSNVKARGYLNAEFTQVRAIVDPKYLDKNSRKYLAKNQARTDRRIASVTRDR